MIFTGNPRTKRERDDTIRRSVRNRVIARPKSGVGSGADHG